MESDDSALAERLVKFLDGANKKPGWAWLFRVVRKLPDSAVNSRWVLEVEHAETQSAVFGALAKLGSSARAALPALNTALNHDNESVRASALNALAKVESNEGKLLNAPSCWRQGRCGPHTAIRELGELAPTPAYGTVVRAV